MKPQKPDSADAKPPSGPPDLPMRFEPSILIADDDLTTRQALRHRFERDERLSDARLFEADSIAAATQILSREQIHVMILDKNFKDPSTGAVTDGIKAIPEFLIMKPDLQILIFSGVGDTQDVVAAIQSGAINYFVKNEDASLMNTKIAKALQIAQLALAKTHAERGGVLETGRIDIPGKSRTTRLLISQLESVSGNHIPVLLLGETGVGKTTAARAIHEFHCKELKLKSRPFYAINIAAMNQNLVESELFGHAQGAFSGALRQKQGFFELVNGGTLFIDEVGELSPEIQVKLLKFIGEGKFFRVGTTKEIEVRFKLICATNQDLEELVRVGKFREDLYLRLNRLTVHVPSVYERRADMPELVAAVLPKVCKEANVYIDFTDIPKGFIGALQKKPPRGNIRGIETALSHLLIFSKRDAFGRPHLDRWRGVEELAYLHGVLRPAETDQETAPQSAPNAISMSDLMTRRLDVVGSEFPGLKKFLAAVREKVVFDALLKKKTLKSAAKELRVSIGSMQKFAIECAAWEDARRLLRENALKQAKDKKNTVGTSI